MEENLEKPLLLLTSLAKTLNRLQTLAATDKDLRGCLRDLGKAILGLVEEPIPASAVIPTVIEKPKPLPPITPLPAPIVPPPSIQPPQPVIKPIAPPVAFQPSTYTPPRFERYESSGPSRPFSPSGPWQQGPLSVEEELPLIEQRCQLKAEGARWAATRHRLLKEGADFRDEIEPNDRAIIARAKALPDCFLWMCHRDAPVAADLSLWDELAGCFETAALATNLLNKAASNEDRPEILEKTLNLAAEAQSALRVAIQHLGAGPDGDQIKLYHWLRQLGNEHGAWIERYMRMDDPADPSLWQNLTDRLQRIEEGVVSQKEKEKRRAKLFSKIRYHLKRVLEKPGEDHRPDWETAIGAADQLIEDGVPHSNTELRELIIPVLGDMPEHLETSKNFQIVLREIERFLDSRPAEEEEPTEEQQAEEVRRAADLLGGRSLVLIGGIKRPRAAAALRDALKLRELIWVEGRDQTYTSFEPDVANPDVAAVVLAIRWSRHGFGEVKEFCDKYAKPLIRLPGGYNPNQVAYHILHQVGERLAGQNGSSGRAEAV